jgi:hypothetical protein
MTDGADTEADADVADVWVFQATGARLPCGLFRTREGAEEWILLHRLSGLLSGYPLDIGLYEWALATGRFTPKSDESNSPRFVGTFNRAVDHYHFEDGEPIA